MWRGSFRSGSLLAGMTGHEPLHLTSVIAAAGEWTAHYLEEAQLVFPNAVIRIELAGRDKSIDC